MKQSLATLLIGCNILERSGPTAVDVSDICLSSREARPGSLFVAVVGAREDGHRFVPDALARGATAVVVSREVEVPSSVACIRVEDTRGALSQLCRRFFGDPSSRLGLIGITGTNGKTSSTFLLEHVFAHAGRSVGVVGTINYRYAGQVLPAPNTTPDLVTFSRLLRLMADAGVQWVMAEVSSHALDQRRVEGLRFAAALFTNLSGDHLDYHATMEAYFEAKSRLFAPPLLPDDPASLAVINAGDGYGQRLLEQPRGGRTWGYRVREPSADAPDPDGLQPTSAAAAPPATLLATRASFDLEGIRATVQSPDGPLDLRAPLLGAHNLENLLGVLGIALGLGLPAAQVLQALEHAPQIPGRLERVQNALGLSVLVDYAHSDDALRRVLECLRPLCPGRLMVVFGCGGDRDRAKRPRMGRVAGEWADLTILTSDNPRSEPPEAILGEILAGFSPEVAPWQPGTPLGAGQRRVWLEVDRRRAITAAIGEALPGDVVLIAGKGHEDYQIVGSEKRHFDDREEATRALVARAGG